MANVGYDIYNDGNEHFYLYERIINMHQDIGPPTISSNPQDGDEKKEKTENDVMGEEGAILSLAFTLAWAKGPVGFNLEIGLALNTANWYLLPHLRWGPSFGEGNNVGVELTYQEMNFIEFIGEDFGKQGNLEIEVGLYGLGVNAVIKDVLHLNIKNMEVISGGVFIGYSKGAVFNMTGQTYYLRPKSILPLYPNKFYFGQFSKD